jgi:hypothetical protein
MKPGDLVNYHMNASAKECREDVHGADALAVVKSVRAGAPGDGLWVTVAIEGTDLVKVDCQVGDGAGCVSPLPTEEPPASQQVVAIEGEAAPVIQTPKTTPKRGRAPKG